ncbi:MAG TPA: hypothetical protein VN947_26340 [Polyangia bacterium]|nr:hypothetical protein [Polyangia bacterium]
MRWILVLLLAGCASSAGVDRHAAAARAQAAAREQPPWALDGVFLSRPRAGQLSASREWERGGHDRVVTQSDDAVLRNTFVRDLRAALPIDQRAARRVRVTLTVQDTAYFEGLAAEAGDVTLRADLLDRDGNAFSTEVLRESASAPLQRSASRVQRLDAAFDRLAARLAQRLATYP